MVQVAGPVSRMCAFAVASRGIYYTAPPDARSGHSTIQFLDFAGGSRPVVVSDRPFGMGLTVSRDQSVVLFTRLDQSPGVIGLSTRAFTGAPLFGAPGATPR